MSQNSIIITQQTPAQTQGYPRVDFDLLWFEAEIQTKGVNIIWETTIKCPCQTKDNSSLSSCQNCMSTGWVALNKKQTKMIIHSMNAQTKYKDWSEEKLGNVTITAMNRDKLSFMDRITILDTESIQSEIIYIKELNDTFFCYTIYNITEVLDVFTFTADNQKLNRLELNTDFTFERNKILFTTDFTAIEGQTVSIRYKHNPQYHIIDIPHDMRVSVEMTNEGKDKTIQLPINAVARRSHYIIDALNFDGNNVLDNSNQ